MGTYIPALDMKRQHSRIRDEINKAVMEVMEGAQFILGPNVEALENEIAAFSQVKYGIGVANGSDALHLALLAAGVKAGEEVITTPFTFFATAGSIARIGAVPVFADIEPDTFNIDAEKIEAAITDKTKAIIPVDLFGQAYDVGKVNEIANKYGLKVIEDAAQAIGAGYRGKRAGSFGHLGCFSFYPTKNLGCFGDGGMVVTDDPGMAEKIRVLRVHGSKPKYYHHVLGYNSRLDELQAAILRVKLRYLNEWIEARLNLAQNYSRLLIQNGLADIIQLPSAKAERQHVYNQYTVRCPFRDELQIYLKDRGIGTGIYYPLGLHLQPVFTYLGYREGDFPETERACKEVLSLPIFPELTGEEQTVVVEALRDFYRQKGIV